MALAALWDVFHGPDGQQEIRTFAIITTHANAAMKLIHDRMPVIVDSKDWPVWLGEQDCELSSLLAPPPDGLLRVWPISRQVNRLRIPAQIVHQFQSESSSDSGANRPLNPG